MGIKRIIPLLLMAAILLAAGAGVLLISTPTEAAPAAKTAAAQPAAQAVTVTGSITEGAYIVNLALGCGCHFNPPQGGLSGGADLFEGPFGSLYPRNITPHPETGIGSYTPEQLEIVLRTGKRPNGEQLFEIMPYKMYSAMAEDDMDNLIAFLLQGQTPISNTVPPRQLLVPVEPFTPTVTPPATAPVSGTARGGYIVNVLGDCRGCHGPNLAGSPGFAPNLTSDPDYGIGLLSAEQISATLQTGVRPVITDSLRFNGSQVGNIMALVIQLATSHWKGEDALAVGQFLKTVPAVGNQAPLFMSPPVASVTVSESYLYSATVADVDVFQPLTVTATTKPAWLALGPTQGAGGRPNGGTAVLTGTPGLADVGPHPVVLEVEDSGGLTATQSFTVTVDPLPAVYLPAIVLEEPEEE